MKNKDYAPAPFNEEDYKIKVAKELKEGNEINALFLIHGYLESYLSDWLFLLGEIPKINFPKERVKDIQKIGFKNLLNIHLVLNNIDFALYNKLKEINDLRNEIAHELTTIDFRNNKTREKIRKKVMAAIVFCGEISKNYKRTLDEKAKKFLPKNVKTPQENQDH